MIGSWNVSAQPFTPWYSLGVGGQRGVVAEKVALAQHGGSGQSLTSLSLSPDIYKCAMTTMCITETCTGRILDLEEVTL